ncbi:uncharacterized protein LOC114662272 [Erpetoichthys calabaricus]|uniref:uncharacterized protein LOC114662272 n=1 Tax=Erpetoichthys calabaricus TaxID=27687 RepID=UPI002233E5AC|nr:uncharacterized protein LOC114662272 [Erpetoichthys calabaricus]
MPWTICMTVIVATIHLVPAEQLFPAKVVTDQETVAEGSKLTLGCMVALNRWEQPQEGSFFLFHNGKKIKSETIFGGKRTAMFTLEHIVAEQAGRYECAYGTESPDRLGDFQTNNSVYIRVKESQVLLILQVQNLTAGVEVIFTCSFPKDSKIKSTSGGSFELRRDGELLLSQSADTSPEVTFRIEHTSENNNGSYVCVFRKGDVYTVKSPPVRLQDNGEAAAYMSPYN